MQGRDPPTLEELEESRQKLIDSIDEAEKLYDTDSKELRLIRNGLKSIEEMIAQFKKQAVNGVAGISP